jgi:hypothetical protein
MFEKQKLLTKTKKHTEPMYYQHLTFRMKFAILVLYEFHLLCKLEQINCTYYYGNHRARFH